MLPIILASMSLSASLAQAQLTSTPPCVLNCVLPAAAQSGCPISQAQCICTSTIFLSVSKACLESKCTPAEIKEAQSAQEKECAGINPVNSTVVRVTQTVAYTTVIQGASMTRDLAVASGSASAASASASGMKSGGIAHTPISADLLVIFVGALSGLVIGL